MLSFLKKKDIAATDTKVFNVSEENGLVTVNGQSEPFLNTMFQYQLERSVISDEGPNGPRQLIVAKLISVGPWSDPKLNKLDTIMITSAGPDVMRRITEDVHFLFTIDVELAKHFIRDGVLKAKVVHHDFESNSVLVHNERYDEAVDNLSRFGFRFSFLEGETSTTT